MQSATWLATHFKDVARNLKMQKPKNLLLKEIYFGEFLEKVVYRHPYTYIRFI